MITYVNDADYLAVLRLQEFLAGRGPWSRSLWGIGVILAMEELYEACAVMKQGHLSEGSVKRMTASLQKRLTGDPAFVESEKNFLRQQIQQIPRAEGASHFAIRELTSRVSGSYLTRWGQVVAAGPFSVERFARSVSAYLLDQGFSGEHLHKLVAGLIKSPTPLTLQQLCDTLQAELRTSPVREFEVLLAFNSVPQLMNGIPATWLAGAAITTWLTNNGFDTAGVRAPVAMVLTVKARDPAGAAQAARDESDRHAARAVLATGKPLDRVPILWVKSAPKPYTLEKVARGVSVKEIDREDRIFANDASQSVDAALELLSHLEGTSPPAAISGGWAAIEGLLADPNDRATAADNLAALVTCSFARAELTALSYRAERDHAADCRDLVGVDNNRERCRILATIIIEGRMPVMRAGADRAAVARLRKLLNNPAMELQAIRDAISESFHRLYRQRNLILHGGRLDSVVLAASLRTAAKLAGAGMDRITHGHYVQRLRPLELVAKANLGLAVLSRETPLDCIDLLEVT